MNLFVIAAAARDGAMGEKGRLPWAMLTGDLRWFKALTMAAIPEIAWQAMGAHRKVQSTTENHVVMGRRTWESMGSTPLPERINWVVSTQKLPGVRTMTSLTCLKALSGTVFVIGGAGLFQYALQHPDCRAAFITEIVAKYPDADTHFPLDVLGAMYRMVETADWARECGLHYRRTLWKPKSLLQIEGSARGEHITGAI